jgi:hypothetical protein
VDAPLTSVKEALQERATLVEARAKDILGALTDLTAAPPDPDLKKRLTKGRQKEITNRVRSDSDTAAELAKNIAAALPEWQKRIEALKTMLFRVT